MIPAAIIFTVFSAGLAYMLFPRFLTYKKMRAAVVTVYHLFKR